MKFYHTTSKYNRDSILKNGLMSSMSSAAPVDDGGTGGVFFCTKLPQPSSAFDTWEADLTDFNVEPDDTTDISGAPEFNGDTWWVVWGKTIPPERLKLVHNEKHESVNPRE